MAIQETIKTEDKKKKTAKKAEASEVQDKSKNIVERNWYLIDATDKTVGRISTAAAVLIRGKNEPRFDPSKDTGNHVVVINAQNVRITGNKLKDKKFYRHSGYPKGLKEKSLKEIFETNPEEIIKRSIKMMLPKNKLSNKLIKRLKVYKDDQHKHKNVKFIKIEDE